MSKNKNNSTQNIILDTEKCAVGKKNTLKQKQTQRKQTNKQQQQNHTHTQNNNNNNTQANNK